MFKKKQELFFLRLAIAVAPLPPSVVTLHFSVPLLQKNKSAVIGQHSQAWVGTTHCVSGPALQLLCICCQMAAGWADSGWVGVVF